MPTYKNTSTTESFKIENTLGVRVIVNPGASVETYKLSLPSWMLKTSDAPYLPATKVYESAFTSPGTKTGLDNCKIIRMTAEGEGIILTWNNVLNTTSFSLIANQPIDFENKGEISSAIFTGSGSVKIEGF